MFDSLPCPGADSLRQLMVGQLPEQEAGPLEQHLLQCDRCGDTVQALKVEDTLVTAMQKAKPTAAQGPEGEVVQGLMGRLQELRPSIQAPGPGTATGTIQLADTPPAELTVRAALPESGLPSSEATLPPPLPSAPSPELTEVVYDFLAPAQTPGELGRLGPYRVLKVLGAGGMGVVFQAEDPHLQRLVALKAMLPALASSPHARQRFLREARTMAAIEHDHIIPIFQVGEERGVPFLAMPLLKGESLDDRLKREGRLPLPEVLRIGREIAEGLAAAHERGLIHRDIKPSNIWLEGKRGRVKVLDFGLARAVEGDVHLTQSGAIAGTPQYMAPEQANGEAVDARSDLFSLGCVLYRLCTGAVPFKGSSTLAVLHALVFDNPRPPREVNPDVPPALSDLVMLLLAKKAADRPPSAQAVVEALETMEREQTGLTARLPQPALPRKEEEDRTVPLTSPAGKGKETGRRRWGWWVAAAVLLGTLGPGGYLYGPAVYRIATDQGQLVIETDDPDVEVVVKQGGEQVKILDAKTQREFNLKAGSYQLELAPGKDGLSLSINQFTLERNGRQIVKVRLESPVIGASPPASGNQPAAEAVEHPAEVKPPAPKLAALVIQPEPLPDLVPGTPLSPLALVSKPAPIKGVRSWTVEARGHRGGINAVAYSPDGHWLATSGADGTVRLWEGETARLVRILVGHAAEVNRVAWSPDSKFLASASNDRTVRTWEADSGRLLLTLREGKEAVLAVAWSPDGKMLASGGWENNVQLWDTVSGRPLRALEGNPSGIYALAFSPDGKVLASASEDKTARLWQADTGELLRTLEGHQGAVVDVAWSPDGKTLATASFDTTARLWDADSGKLLRTLKGAFGMTGVSWSPNGKTLATGNGNEHLELWDAGSGQLLRSLQHRGAVGAVAWSPDGKTLASGTSAGTLSTWEPGLGQLLNLREGHWVEMGQDLAWSPDGKTLACVGAEFRVRLWEAETGKSLRTPPEMIGTHVFAFSPDGKTLATGTWGDATVRLYEAESGRPLRTLQGNATRVKAAAFAPDGKTLATAGDDGTVGLWEPESGKLRGTLKGHGGQVLAVAWSPDGKTLASAGDDHTVRLWEAGSGKPLRTLQGQPGWVTDLAWSPDGKRLASSNTSQGIVQLWSPGSDQALETLGGHKGRIAIAWSADGKRLVLVGDRKAETWLAETGQMLQAVEKSHGWGVFSPAGRLMASPRGNAVQLWEQDTGRVQWTLVPLANDEALTLTGEGHYRGPDGIEGRLVYVVQTDQGQETLTPEEFANKYGWKNDPEQVRLTGR